MNINLQEVGNKSSNYREALIAEKDRKTPMHEEIVLWLYEELETQIKDSAWYKDLESAFYHKLTQVFELFSADALLGILLEICATKAPDVPIGLQKSMANLASTSFSDYFNMTPILEKPVTGNNNFILGYLDLQISISIYDIEVHLISLLKRYVKEKEELAKNLSSEDAYRLRNLNEYYIGYLERMGSPWEKYCNKSECLTFEIKGALPLLGDLLRQLQYYQQSQVPNIIVVAPDPKYTRILKEQGFGFIKYKDPNLVDCVLEYCGLKKFKFASIK